QSANVVKTGAWRQRRLIFELDPLTEVATQFNRYNRRLNIRVEGQAARAKRFSGVFDADDPHALAKLLESYEDLSVEEREGEIVIRDRKAGAPAVAQEPR